MCFWFYYSALFQEKDTKKVFYGLDDIKGADEIIIVLCLPFNLWEIP
jgi:hypothetical protein